jgi:NAD(P)-dependent dehydrogenase (short-subunit alcohol dehydrogenase family)
MIAKQVMATDVDAKGLEETKRMLGGVHTHVGDVTKEEDVEQLFAKARELMGGCPPAPEISC